MGNKEFFINNLEKEDWEQVCSIYLEGIDTGNATFQKEAPTWEEWDTAHLLACRLVVRENIGILGWVALSPVSSRCVYSGVAEVSIYVSQTHRGQGIGSALLKTLIDLSEKNGYWTLQAGIFPENKTSIKLHKNFGFREIGCRERIGKMNGVWRDVILLERRSNIVGI
jgi:phosphinothricin acetyltransferase